jgi:hypothetical protein
MTSYSINKKKLEYLKDWQTLGVHFMHSNERLHRWHIYKIFVGNPEGQSPLEWPRHRWKYNMRTDLSEKGWEYRSSGMLLVTQ